MDGARFGGWWLAVPAVFFAIGLLVVGLGVGRNRRTRPAHAGVQTGRSDDKRRL